MAMFVQAVIEIVAADCRHVLGGTAAPCQSIHGRRCCCCAAAAGDRDSRFLNVSTRSRARMHYAWTDVLARARAHTHTHTHTQGDNEMPTFCAYNFPAVVLTVGRDNWVHLEEAYTELLKDIQVCCRLTRSLVRICIRLYRFIGSHHSIFSLFLRFGVPFNCPLTSHLSSLCPCRGAFGSCLR
jgi:hypothetical protein